MEINSEEWHKKTGDTLASITARMERDNLLAMGVPEVWARKTLTLDDVKAALRGLKEDYLAMTPEQEERLREQLRGKKPGDYVECDLFIGIMPDFEKHFEKEKFHPNRQCARCPRCYPEGKSRSPWCPYCQGVISKDLREQGLTLYCTGCNEKVTLCTCLEGK